MLSLLSTLEFFKRIICILKYFACLIVFYIYIFMLFSKPIWVKQAIVFFGCFSVCFYSSGLKRHISLKMKRRNGLEAPVFRPTVSDDIVQYIHTYMHKGIYSSDKMSMQYAKFDFRAPKISQSQLFLRSESGHDFKQFPAKKKQATDWLTIWSTNQRPVFWRETTLTPVLTQISEKNDFKKWA